jgi:tetratricopeptide (TPR) repeat protein
MNGLFPALFFGGLALFTFKPQGADAVKIVPDEAPQNHGLGGYIQATHAELANQLPQANTGYLAALAHDPDNAMLRQRSLQAALAANDFDNATRLAKTLPIAQQPAMAQLALLVAAVRDNDITTATEITRRLQKLGPSLPVLQAIESDLAAASGTPVGKLLPKLAQGGWVGQWHAARLALQASDVPAAQVLLQQALATNPGAYPAAQLALAVMPTAATQTILDDFNAANPTLGPALQAPVDPPEMGTPAMALSGNIAAALQAFALEIWAEGAPSAALQLSALAQHAGPDAQLGNFLPYAHALLLEANGNTTQAQAIYQMLGATPGFASLAQLRLNEIAFAQATTPRARARAANAAWQLAQAHQTTSIFWHSAAQTALAAGQYQRAAAAATALLPLLPQTPSATLPLRQAELYFARGAALAQANQTTQAEADLKTAIALNPAHAEALNYLGYMWVDTNQNLMEAYTLLKRAYLLAPQSAAITDSVGWAYYRKGDYATARDYLERAAALDTESPEILSHLADTYAKLGQADEAAKLLRRALALAQAGAEVPSADFLKTLRTRVHKLK